jgi:hypothetical protein
MRIFVNAEILMADGLSKTRPQKTQSFSMKTVVKVIKNQSDSWIMNLTC